ncbi:MAG: hypothetical protein HQK75_04965 [Candidatus Magnetomorum sp.]|nr:hypothetical protein [Candidatus Magnetomorum sp.]
MKQSICFLACVFLVANVFFYCSVGCTRHPFYSKKQDLMPELKKKIGIAQFDNRLKLISEPTMDKFYQNIVSDMNPLNPFVYFSTTDGQPEILQKSSLLVSTDHVDRQALIKTGKEKGYQAIIWGGIHDISIVSKKSGFWGFRKEKTHVRIRGEFSLFDCETHSKLWYAPVNETYLFKTLFDPPVTRKAVLDDQTIERVLAKLSQKIVPLMSDRLKKEPWKGFILNNEGNVYLISSGKQSGLLENMIFDVIGSMGTLSGIYGQNYYIPGNPIGRVQIIDVDDHTSKAIPLYGNQLENSIAIHEIMDK